MLVVRHARQLISSHNMFDFNNRQLISYVLQSMQNVIEINCQQLFKLNFIPFNIIIYKWNLYKNTYPCLKVLAVSLIVHYVTPHSKDMDSNICQKVIFSLVKDIFITRKEDVTTYRLSYRRGVVKNKAIYLYIVCSQVLGV